MLQQLTRDLAVRYDMAGETKPLLDRVSEMLVGRQGLRAKGSPGKPSASKPPLDIQILDFLTTVEGEASAWEHSFRRVMDLPGVTRRGLKDRIEHLPELANQLGITLMTQALERDVAWWHERCMGYVVESPIERRYKPTHLAAEALGKSQPAFKSYCRRRGIEPIGYMSISFDGGLTRAAVWDMREVVARA
ncbi:MAG TPA: hypothetical protein VK659_28995 [Asanoa sp.]|nr:hypothetical protein [Asanoa sp.]